MKKMMFLSQNWYFSVQKALIYYTFNKSHHNSFILLVFLHVANFRYVANFTFLTLLYIVEMLKIHVNQRMPREANTFHLLTVLFKRVYQAFKVNYKLISKEKINCDRKNMTFVLFHVSSILQGYNKE